MSNFPQPYTLPLERGRPLLVLSCSSVKAPAPADAWLRFAELYDGPMWRQVKASGFPLTNVAAISALYGFLEPGHPVMTYDHKMDEERSRWFCGFGNHVARLADMIARAGAAFIVGGALYQELARTAIRYRPELAELVTFAAGSYLEQRKQLGEWLRRQERELELEATPAGLQGVLAGAGRASDRDQAQRLAAAPLRPARPQAACDVGLFSDARDQLDLLELARVRS